MKYNNLPLELKKERAWVNVWDHSKIPMCSTIREAASSSLPETWSSYLEAAEAVRKGMYDGIGYMFHDSGVIGIDVDDCYEGCFLNKQAADIIGHCLSYTEKSRSGKGIHILVKGVIPFRGRNNRAGVEIYQSGRYFIMTGDTLIYQDLIENQSAIDYVVETYFPDVPREGENSSVPRRIYSPVYPKPINGKVALKPSYPLITPGSRNISLTSLAGQLHTQGYSKSDIYRELLYANQEACKPPLERSEVESIVNSITKYRRR